MDVITGNVPFPLLFILYYIYSFNFPSEGGKIQEYIIYFFIFIYISTVRVEIYNIINARARVREYIFVRGRTKINKGQHGAEQNVEIQPFLLGAQGPWVCHFVHKREQNPKKMRKILGAMAYK